MTTPPETHLCQTHAYRVVRTLGQGGQGRALLVEREDEPGSRYVLKLLRLEHVEDWKQVELFEREVTTLETLDHPGIPQLLDRLVEDGRTAGIVSTFVEGRTVAHHIADGVTLPPGRFEQVLRDGLEILDYLRGRVPPVLHRDINPANVMLGPDRAWLIDFGAVRVGTKTGMTSVGTFGYMAPEHLMGRPTTASDMFGLGMTMVALGEGRDVGDLPVDDATGQLDPSRVLTTVEPRVREVVLSMTKPGLEHRLADPREALRRLDAPPLPVAIPQATEVVPSRSRAAPMVAAVAAAAVAVAGGVFYMLIAVQPHEVRHEDVSVPATPPDPPRPPPPPPAAPVPPVTPPAGPSPAPAKVVETELDDDAPKLTVNTTPAGATVYVDGREVCTAACTVQVAFGRHEVRLVHGDAQIDRRINVLEDMTLSVSFDRP